MLLAPAATWKKTWIMWESSFQNLNYKKFYTVSNRTSTACNQSCWKWRQLRDFFEATLAPGVLLDKPTTVVLLGTLTRAVDPLVIRNLKFKKALFQWIRASFLFRGGNNIWLGEQRYFNALQIKYFYLDKICSCPVLHKIDTSSPLNVIMGSTNWRPTILS